MIKEFVPEMRSDKKDAEIARLRERAEKAEADNKSLREQLADAEKKIVYWVEERCHWKREAEKAEAEKEGK